MTHRLILILAVCVVQGCSAYPGEATECSDAGCKSGLMIQIGNAPVGPWTVTVTSGQDVRTFQCPANNTCNKVAFFEGFLPTSVTVNMTVGQMSAEYQGSPTLRTVRPNGPRCSPACSQPFMQITAPED